MPRFTYIALDSKGEKKRGEFDAHNRSDAHKKLESKGLTPIDLREKKVLLVSKKQSKSDPSKPIRLSKNQIILFTEELSDLLEAGLQLETAMAVMERRKEASSIKPLASAIRNLLREGISFSAALKRVSPDFGELYYKMVAAGEQSGALHSILKSKLENLILVSELKRRVTSALVYPAFITLAGMLLLFIFMTYLVPQLTTLFQQGGKEMPFMTQALISTSNFMASYWWLIIGGAILLVIGFLQFTRTEGGQMWWHRVQLKIPLVGSIISMGFYAQFLQTLSTLLYNGISLLPAIRLVQGTTQNVYIRSGLVDAVQAISDGVSLSRALSRKKIFPDEMIDMVIVGEQTGKLANALQKASSRYDKELNRSIKRLTAMIQPTIIVLMALIVGVVAFSMMSGIFQAVSGIR